MKCLTWFSLAVLLLVGLVPGQGPAVHRDALRHFSIELPAGWQAIRPDALARAGVTAGVTETGIEAFLGFSPTGDYAYPYFEIQVLPQTLGAYDLDDLREWFRATAGEFDERKAGAEFPSLATLSRPLLDVDQWKYLVPIAMDKGGAMKIRAFHAGILGQDHQLQLYMYATAEQLPDLVKVFDRSLASFRFDPGFAWVPSSSLSYLGFLLLVLALVLAPLVFRAKQKRTD